MVCLLKQTACDHFCNPAVKSGVICWYTPNECMHIIC